MAFPVKAGSAPKALEAMAILGLEGLSVTMPHKAAVAAALTNLTPSAQALGAVNCVFKKDGELWGDSTDGDGLVDAVILHSHGTAAEPAFDRKRVLVVGTGGAGRSICEAIGRRCDADLYVAGRTFDRVADAARLADGATAISTDEVDDLDNIDVLINATSVGMTGGPDEQGLVVPPAVFGEGQLVVDIVYQPRVTPLLAAAREKGSTTMNGVPMLVHQAALAFHRWTGQEPPLNAMTQAVELELPS